MPDLPDRFRALDQLEVPDIDSRARALGSRPPTEPDGPSPKGRAAIIALAAIVALVGVGFVVQAFRGDRAGIPDRPQPAAPGVHELIAFSTIGNGVGGSKPTIGYSIAVVNADGSGFRYLTQASADAPDLTDDPLIQRYSFASDDSPTWSPDGSTIAFVRHYAEGVDSLCTIGVDGSDFRVVVRDFQGAELAWSPDGSTFAFYSERDGGVHLVNVAGTNERALDQRTSGPNQNTPSWSPDGRWIYFAARDVRAAHPDGSGLHDVFDPSWFVGSAYLSPDGSTIALQRLDTDPVTDGGSVWLVDATGSDLRRLTPDDGVTWSALGWSADASRVLLARPGPHDVPGLWTIGADGSGLAQVDLPRGVGPFGSAASWAPSG
ncbi:MAG TPA: hypothetical protein VLX89_06185 [Actinomycetota bacterium]|nr:hypothetical protein [Actinomycetota bacterium]